MTDPLSTARDALGRHAWDEAFAALEAADAAGPLSAADLESMADAAWWSGHVDEAAEALERAHAAYERSGVPDRAAATALLLSERAYRRLEVPVARGWLSRAEHLLEGLPESPVHARLAFIHANVALMMDGDPGAALEHAERAAEIARRHGDVDLQSMAMSFTGSVIMKQGRIEEGRAMLDEAAAAATSGTLEPKAACDIYCNTIATCRALADYRRAAEWNARAERWMRRHSIGGYPGVCRVHRAELMRLRGAWAEAEQEARHACEELERFRMMDTVGVAHHEVGEIRLRLGDLDGAEEAFRLAYECGMDPQPGMALLLLARGDLDEAARSIARTLERESADEDQPNPLARTQLLPAQVEIALAADDVATALDATEEMEEIASAHDAPAWTAAALSARGALELRRGDHETATGVLDRAWRLWQGLELPYESARARMWLGEARTATGDTRLAQLDLRAARTAFEQLGATADLHAVEELLSRAGPARTPATGRRVSKTFMFTDIVTSTDLVGIIGDEAWEQLLRWHDRSLRGAFAEHGGEEVRHTGDGFFVVFESARQGIDCAVAIQRLLAEHRREHGFAPWVRIGLHAAEATRDGADYSGHGVHAAARIGGIADREQVVASSSTIEQAGSLPYPVSEPWEERLKGITGPVEVRSVEWRR